MYEKNYRNIKIKGAYVTKLNHKRIDSPKKQGHLCSTNNNEGQVD